MTDPLGQSQVLPYLKELSKSGYRFTIISFEKKSNFNRLQPLIQSICDQNKIHWIPLSYTKKPPVISTVYDLIRLRRKIKEVFHHQPPAIIHCRSYLTMMIAIAFKKKTRLLFDIRGFWVDERIDGNIWNIRNPIFRFIYQYLKKKEKTLFAEADGIISLSAAACPIIREWQPTEHPAPISVIPCCTDSEHFNPNSIPVDNNIQIRKSLNLPEKGFILGYIGGISTWYLPAEMFDFFKVLLEKRPDAYFLIITQEDKEELFRLAEKCNLPPEKIRVTQTDRQHTPLYLSVFDASVFFIKPAFSKQASSPTKMGELMCMDIPVVSNSGVGDTEAMIRDTGSGAVVNSFTREAYEQATETLLKIHAAKQKGSIRAEGMKLFGLQQGVEKYAEMYQYLLHQE